MKHTETPWIYRARLSGSENHKGFVIGHDYQIADVFPLDSDGKEGEANARFIVLACNHFEEMKEVVEYFVQLIEDGIDTDVIKWTSDGCFSRATDLLRRIEEAERV